MFCSNTPFDGKIKSLILNLEVFSSKTFISEWHVMIVIPCFKSALRRPKVVLSRICAAYLCLIHETLLQTVPVYWAACFVSTIAHSGWLFKALEKLFVVMFGYYISHILYTAVTQFDRVFVKSFMISVMFSKVLYNKLHKDLSYKRFR